MFILKFLFKNTRTHRIAWSVVNALFMFWLTFFLLTLPYVLPDEYLLVRYTSVFKNLVLGLQETPDSTRFAFINVAWDKELIKHPEVMDGNEVITDRAKLIGLLRVLQRNPNHKFIVLDINFKSTTQNDSLLTALINTTPRIVVSYHRDEKDKPDYPDLKIKPLGLSDIEQVWDMSLKFKIFFNDSLKSTPLLMYEQIHKKKFKKGKWFYYLGNQRILNSFILDYRIRNFHYQNRKYPQNHLGEWISLGFVKDSTQQMSDEDWAALLNGTDESSANLDIALSDTTLIEESTTQTDSALADTTALDTTRTDTSDIKQANNLGGGMYKNTIDYSTAEIDTTNLEFLYEFTKDRIIFVGDFEDRDIHETIYGKTPGPLILLDAFLALEAGDNVITIWFLLYLLVAYTLVSYITISYKTIYGRFIQKITHHTNASFVEAMTIYIVIFSLISIVSFFMFSIHIGVLVLAFYLNLVERAKHWVLKYKNKRLLKIAKEEGIG
jgi:hypothetical protein